MELAQIQEAIRGEQLDGWLFYDFRKSNPIAYQVLQLPVEEMYTRRWFYYVPVQGEPTALISAVEPHVLHSLPGQRLSFRTWQEMQDHLKELQLQGKRLAMEYSPRNAIPYVSRVDAGTLELVSSLGVEVVTSANLAQRFIAQLTPDQITSHREAGRRLIAVKDQLFAELRSDLQAGRELDEYGVQQRFLKLILEAGLIPPEGEAPIVAVNSNSGNPHYEPTIHNSSPIRRGDLILFDFWATLPQPGAVYADYTWVAFAGTREEIPAKQREVFEIVRRARDTGIAFARERLAAGEKVEGRQVDDVVRTVIQRAGYGDYFVHRTGHSIGSADLHGNGANIDNFETQDERVLLPYTCNSIEPGIYLPEFGVRSEVDLLIFERDAEVTGVPAQGEITPLLP
ncbi:M24 family metallopeptidase [Tengunoibacter tsumagoiensis]|uniref:Peptidase M24 n=1 Tax=Tengunoibacter tsumagoiensis TaxID=2014871 RepID=A0A402A525_9CHLR|nr:M24 family metallopeptidase [Tengunoibacter tsumagoiensis]GCE14115.1 peptidase M24 [Tengunoibacter tsumagoiensis]